MSLILRVLNQKSKWEKDRQPQFVTRGDVQGDALKDLGCSGNCLSIWLIEDDQSNLNRVLTALAANRDSFNKIDFILLEKHRLIEHGFALNPSNGETCDDGINARFHVDVINLTARSITLLAQILFEHGEINRKSEGEVKRLLKLSIDGNTLNLEKINKNLLSKLTN